MSNTHIKNTILFYGEMSVSVIIGNMFSGKTSELIRRLKRYKIIGKRVLVVNCAKDTRSPEEVVKTHDGITFECIKTKTLNEIIHKNTFKDAEIIAVDEAQFFSDLRRFCELCLSKNKSVLLAGLDGDYRQRKFGTLIDCIPMADEVVKLSALCMDCMDGTPGPFTKRTIESDELELIGDKDIYKSVCIKHLFLR
jgi:thymidine kinase